MNSSQTKSMRECSPQTQLTIRPKIHLTLKLKTPPNVDTKSTVEVPIKVGVPPKVGVPKMVEEPQNPPVPSLWELHCDRCRRIHSGSVAEYYKSLSDDWQLS